MLEKVLATGRLEASDDPAVVAAAEHVVVVVGTPVDEHLNPDPRFVLRAIEEMLDHLRDGQILILRSTVYPGVTAMVERSLQQAGKAIDVSFCPERIAEGKALVFDTGDVLARVEKHGDLFADALSVTQKLPKGI